MHSTIRVVVANIGELPEKIMVLGFEIVVEKGALDYLVFKEDFLVNS